MSKPISPVLTLLLVLISASASADTYRIRLYFGLSKPDGGAVSTQKWEAFEKNTLATTFDGFNIVDSRGYYKGVPERSKIVTLIIDDKDMPKVEQLARSYAKAFGQESVMLVKVKVSEWVFVSADK